MKKLALLLLVLILTGCNSEVLEEKNKEIVLLQAEVETFKVDAQIHNKLISDMEKDYLDLKNEIIVLEETLIEANEVIDALKVLSMKEPIDKMVSGNLLSTALEVIELIEIQDFTSVSTYVDPILGLRFSPYSYINFASDLWFSPSQVSNLMSDPLVYTWGNYDGSGDPITTNFIGYYNEFVYDENYSNPHLIGNNTLIGSGNMINNINTIYPTASYVEFHFTGFNPSYDGMDWSSLRLIFENVGGVWKLIGIEHDSWTI